MDDLHNNSSHVVAAKTLGGGQVSSTACVHELLNTSLQLLHGSLLAPVVAVVNGLVAEVNSLLGGHHIPDTVTSQQDEFGVVGNGHGLNVGERSHNLVSHLKQRVVFVFKISKRAGKGEHTVDTTILNKTLGGVNAFLLKLVVGFVIHGHINSLLVLGHHGTRVTSVSAVDFSGGLKNNGGSATSI